MRKNAKTALSVLLAALMLMTLMPSVTMADVGDHLIFDMDLSAYEADGAVGNSVADNSSTVTANGAPEIAYIEGSNQPYLKFDRTQDMYVDAKDAVFADSDALTVELWLKPENWTSSKTWEAMFTMWSGSSCRMNFYRYGTSVLRYDIDRDGTGDGCSTGFLGQLAVNNGKWTHMVFTRAWNSTAGQWTGKVYIDGVAKAAVTSNTGLTRKDDEDNNTFFRLGKGTGGKFQGSIGTFRVYDTILSDTDVEDCYDSTVNNYYWENPDDWYDGEREEVVLEEYEFVRLNLSGLKAGTTARPKDLPYLTMTASGRQAPDADITIREAASAADGSKIKYLRGGNDDSRDSTDTYIGYSFDSAYEGDFVLDTNVFVTGTAGSRSLTWISSNKTSKIYSFTGSAAKDEYGFMNLRFIFRRTSDGKYRMYVLDRLTAKDEADTKNTYNPYDYNAVVEPGTIEQSSCSKILFQQYCGPTQINKGAYYGISEFRVFEYREPEVTDVSSSAAVRGADSITLTLSENVDPDSIGDTPVVIKNAVTGEEVKLVSQGYNLETGEITLAMKQYLDYDTEYEVTLSGVRNLMGFEASEDSEYTFTTDAAPVEIEDLEFCDSLGNAIPALGTNTDAKVAFKAKSTDGSSIKVMLALYDEKGVLTEISTATHALSSNAQPVELSLDDGITPKAGYKLRLYIWEITDTTQRPVLAAPAVLN